MDLGFGRTLAHCDTILCCICYIHCYCILLSQKLHKCSDHNGFGWLASLLCGTMLVFFVDLADPFCEFVKFLFLVGVNRKRLLTKKEQTK